MLTIPTTVWAIKAVAVEFLTKIFSDDALLSAIHQAVERSKIVSTANTADHDLDH